MKLFDSQIRWLVTAITVAATALALAAPAGAWEDPENGRQAGNGHGSMPNQFDDKSVPSTTVGEGASVQAAMNPGLVTRDGKTFVPGVSAKGESALVEVGPNLRVTERASLGESAPGVTDMGNDAVAASSVGSTAGSRSFSADSYLRHSRAEQKSLQSTFVPGVTDTRTGIAAELGRPLAPVVPQATTTSSDDGFEIGTVPVAVAASLAAALLMVLMSLAIRSRRRHILLH